MKRLTYMAAALLLVSACAQSPTGGSTSESNEASGTICLDFGPNVDLILNSGTTSELAGVIADAWAEQEQIDLPRLAGTTAARVRSLNPESIDVTETWLTQVDYGRLGTDEVPKIEFSNLLLMELNSTGLNFRIVQTEVTTDKTISMSLQDGLTQQMRLTVQEVRIIQDLLNP